MPGKTMISRGWVALAAALVALPAVHCRVAADTTPPRAQQHKQARKQPAPKKVAKRPVAPRPKAPRMFGKDVTAKLRAMNSRKYAEPPRYHRSISVTQRRLSSKRIRRRNRGFEVRFPSNAPITTPAVYKGKVYVSGGFRSKQFYAFSANTGKLEWGVNLGDDGPSAPACEDDVCVFNTESCTVFALNAHTGKRLWSRWLGDPQLSAPTIAKGRVFTAYPTRRRYRPKWRKGRRLKRLQRKLKPLPPGASHVLAAFALHTGKLLWQRWIDGDVMSAPVASGNELYITTFAGTVVELDQATGTILSATKARATSAPLVSGDDLFYTQRVDQKGATKAKEGMAKGKRSRRKGIRLRKQPPPARPRPGQHSGKYGLRWPGPLLANLGGALDLGHGTALPTRRARPLIVAGGPYRPVRKSAPYLDRKVQRRTRFYMKGMSLDAANGFSDGAPAAAKPRAAFMLIGQRTVSRLQAFQGSRVLRFHKRNFNTMGDEILCTDPLSGGKLWSRKIKGNINKTGGFLATPPAAAGKYLVVGLTKGELLMIDPLTGKTAKKISVGAPVRSQPVVHNGWIYVGTQNGRLVAIDTRIKGLTGWSQWGGDAARSSAR